MESYHTNDEGAIGADESFQPRHRSIVIIDPPATFRPLHWTAEDDDPCCRVIDALPNTTVQTIASVIYDLLFDYAQQQIVTSPVRISIALIAGVAECSKGALWRSLPLIAHAGLLVWEDTRKGTIIVRITPPDLPWRALTAIPEQPMRERPSIIRPLLRELERRKAIAITFSDSAQHITHLRRQSRNEAGHA